LIATKDREELLVSRAVPAVLSQTRRPDILIIVDDGGGLQSATQKELVGLAEAQDVELLLLPNNRARGAAGAWNTGLTQLASRHHEGFVAFLDDDDEWDRHHIEVNLALADAAPIVVSGLRMRTVDRAIPRGLIGSLDDRAFLVGNPGWQGSNTFVSLDLLLAIGGFREGLLSLNDRDLAIRLLRHPRGEWRLTGRWTATWHVDTPGNLSEPRSDTKREGLRMFWRLYGHEMSALERRAFFQRAGKLFGIATAEIVGHEPERIPTAGIVGSERHA